MSTTEPPTRSTHAEILHRLVAGLPGSTTAELQLAYDAIAPVAYRGLTSSPVHRRWRREQLNELVDEDVLASFDTPRGRVWVPLELPEGVEVHHAATAARASG